MTKKREEGARQHFQQFLLDMACLVVFNLVGDFLRIVTAIKKQVAEITVIPLSPSAG